METQRKKFLKLGETVQIDTVEKESKPKEQRNVFWLTQATEIGFSIAIPICAGALFGVWLDDKFSTHPKFTLSFLFGGIILAGLSLYNIVNQFSKKKKS